MLMHKQLFGHDPANGIWGDCYRTAIACLLDLAPEAVPHEHRHMSWTEHEEAVNAWLATRGLREVSFYWSGEGENSFQRCLDYFSFLNAKTPFLLSGTSARGVHHVVIVQDGKVIHDPSPAAADTLAPCENGFYYVTFLGALLKQAATP
jgi:hypothetical protein